MFTETPLPVHVCVYCEEQYVPKCSTQKYCSKPCAKYMAERIGRQKEPAKWRELDKVRNAKRKGYRRRYRSGIGKEKTDRARTNRQFLVRYGITFDDYERMHEAQKGLCAICSQPETTLRLRTMVPMRLSVDHDHRTGNVRGLLCRNCNKGIGCFHDSLELMKKAMEYLDHHRQAAPKTHSFSNGQVRKMIEGLADHVDSPEGRAVYLAIKRLEESLSQSAK